MALLPLASCHQARTPGTRSPERVSLSSILAAGAERETHQLTIGFGIGFLGRARLHEIAIRAIAADGFKYVRAYEPFRRNVSTDYRPLISSIDIIVSSGLVPFLAISNFPYDLMPENPDSIFRDIPYPANRRRGVAEYSNRYPPVDIGVYRNRLQQLVSALGEKYGKEALEAWYFEIGNEPDAPRFFWGTPAHFQEVFDTARQVLKSYNPRLQVGGAAFTSLLVAEASKSPDYRRFAEAIASSPDTDFLSFHIYPRNYTGGRSMAEAIRQFGGTDHSKPRVVSEWNVASSGSERADAILESERFVPYLLDIIVACWHSGVDMLLIHKLMDYPRSENPQLGLFDGDGNPKRAYTYVRLMKDIVESGYAVIDSEEALTLRGERMLFVRARRAISIDFSAYHVGASSAGVDPESASLPAGDWVFLEFREDRRPEGSSEGQGERN